MGSDYHTGDAEEMRYRAFSQGFFSELWEEAAENAL